MPTPVTRFALGAGALLAALVLGGAGAGFAAAVPDEPGNVAGSATEPDPGNVTEPEPTVTATPVARTLHDQLRDVLQRPLSIFGNGRAPGQQATSPGGTPRSASTTRAKKSDPERDREAVLPRKPPVAADPDEVTAPSYTPEKAPLRKSARIAEVRLPFTPAFSVPVPTVPGTEGMRWSIDMSDPSAAYSTVEQTFYTVNSLLADAYAPYNPFPPPPPKPSFRTTEEEAVEADGVGVTAPMSGAGPVDGELPVLQAPMAGPRLVPPRSLAEPAQGGAATPDGLGGGSAGVPTPGLRGAAAPTGTVPAEAIAAGGAANAPMGSPAFRQGYPQYLRTARLGELAAVALPGLAGLLAATASGGLIGYRQANSGRHLRAEAGRFLS